MQKYYNCNPESAGPLQDYSRVLIYCQNLYKLCQCFLRQKCNCVPKHHPHDGPACSRSVKGIKVPVALHKILLLVFVDELI